MVLRKLGLAALACLLTAASADAIDFSGRSSAYASVIGGDLGGFSAPLIEATVTRPRPHQVLLIELAINAQVAPQAFVAYVYFNDLFLVTEPTAIAQECGSTAGSAFCSASTIIAVDLDTAFGGTLIGQPIEVEVVTVTVPGNYGSADATLVLHLERKI